MSAPPASGSYPSFRAAIDAFLHDRLQGKLDKLSPDDPKCAKLRAEYQREPWLEDAARRVKQLQAVTHSLKPIHPDARGTNLYVEPSSLPSLDELGSHALGHDFVADVVGNAAALDVYKFLKLDVGGRTLLQALEASDADALQALDDDKAKAGALREAFIGLTAGRTKASSHTLAKQLYWLTGEDASDDTQYHLLAPLYPASLTHAVYEEVQDARFGEASKLAREARREGKPYDGVYREYRDLAVQKMGGTKPQNVSQLNSEHGGNNYLLASLPPPLWREKKEWWNRLPVNVESIFDDRYFGARPFVRDTVRTLKKFLLSNPKRNEDTRNRVRDLVEQLRDELFTYAGELWTYPAGWTKDDKVKLVKEEQLWLDPFRSDLPGEEQFAPDRQYEDRLAQIGERFSNWLNSQLTKDFSVDEARVWRAILLAGDDAWVQQLRQRRDELIALREEK